MKNKDWNEEKDVMFRKLIHEKKGLTSKDWLKQVPVERDTFYRRKKELLTEKYIIKKKSHFLPNVNKEFKKLYDNFSIDEEKVERYIKKIPNLPKEEAFIEAYPWIILLMTLNNKFDFHKLIGELDLSADEKLLDYSIARLKPMVKNLLNQLYEKDVDLTFELIQIISEKFDFDLKKIIEN